MVCQIAPAPRSVGGDHLERPDATALAHWTRFARQAPHSRRDATGEEGGIIEKRPSEAKANPEAEFGRGCQQRRRNQHDPEAPARTAVNALRLPGVGRLDGSVDCGGQVESARASPADPGATGHRVYALDAAGPWLWAPFSSRSRRAAHAGSCWPLATLPPWSGRVVGSRIARHRLASSLLKKAHASLRTRSVPRRANRTSLSQNRTVAANSALDTVPVSRAGVIFVGRCMNATWPLLALAFMPGSAIQKYPLLLPTGRPPPLAAGGRWAKACTP